MNSTIPLVLASFFRECLDQPSLVLLTSVLDTPTNWLLVRFLVASLRGINGEISKSTIQPAGAPPETSKVVFVSIWRPFEVWAEIARKNGLNLQDAIAQGKLSYIDGLSTSSTTNTPGSGLINLKSPTLQDLNTAITTAIQRLTSQSATSKTTVIIDGLDFLLAYNPNLQSTDLLQTVLDLQHRTHTVVLTCAADEPLLHNVQASATPLEIEHAIYARTLAHQARYVFQLRPLETGHSREVSGTIRASRGGAWEVAVDGTDGPDEGEWLYHVGSDGVVKVWGRGEA